MDPLRMEDGPAVTLAPPAPPGECGHRFKPSPSNKPILQFYSHKEPHAPDPASGVKREPPRRSFTLMSLCVSLFIFCFSGMGHTQSF